ncbi:hypothetical protein GHK86_13590, partial [Acidimicrobiaceae bacterium USS-CC1]|nr:hypothetical protein [Acidiferrimicrobium australe]
MRQAWWRSGVVLATLVGSYHAVIRPWQVRWGATDEEVTARLPGDERIAEPATQVTRAIGVDAPPEAVWPWLVQLGADRGGFYSYDWLEDLFGLGIHSADAVVAAWQQLAVGDLVAADARRRGGWYVVDLRPAELLALQVADLRRGRPTSRADRPGWEFLWTFALRPTPDGTTRLVVRERVAVGRRPLRLLLTPVGIVSFVMTRRMLLGLAARAEAAHRGAGARGAGA